MLQFIYKSLTNKKSFRRKLLDIVCKSKTPQNWGVLNIKSLKLEILESPT